MRPFDVREPEGPAESGAKRINRGHQTQWAAQFAVASELCKRGYEVSFTMGNATPVADLMVVSPVRKKMFLVHVKGLYKRNPWVLKRKAPRDDLFYILAFVPPDAPNEFFIMSQQQANHLIDDELKRLKRRYDYSPTGFLWTQALDFRNNWDILPKYFGAPRRNLLMPEQSVIVRTWRPCPTSPRLRPPSLFGKFGLEVRKAIDDKSCYLPPRASERETAARCRGC